MPDTRTAVATRNEQKAEKKKSALRFVEQLGPQIARALPAHLTGDRMTRLALTAVQKTPDLAECSQVSFAGALLTAAALGLEPNTPTGEAYLVPYKGEATLIVGYQGMIKLFWQSPLAASIRAEVVYADDDFDYSYGTGAFLRHKPARRGDNMGDPVAYYAHATLTTGAEAFVVLTPEEIRALRAGKVGSNGGIPDPQHHMERKTAIRQLIKYLPKSPNLALAAQSDEKGGTDLYRARAAERVQPAAIEGRVEMSTGEIITPDGPEYEAEPDAAPPGDAPKATQAQMNKIHALLAKRGITSDDAVRSAIVDITGREIASRTELLRDEAAQVIKHLEALPAGDVQ